MAEQRLMSGQKVGGLRNFVGGLNSTSGPLGVQENESPDLQNVDFDKFGSILKRSGSARLNSTAMNSGALVTGLHWYEQADGDRFFVGTAGNKIYKMEDVDGTWDDITNSLTVTAGNLYSFITHIDTVVGTNGTDPLWKTTGGNASLLGGINAGGASPSITKAKFIEVFSNYTFVANVTDGGTAYPSRLYWSAIDTIETWSANDFRSVGLDDGQAITGLKELGDRLVIYKTRSIWTAFFTGDADIPFVFRKTPADVGCASGYSIQKVNNGHVFMSWDGFYFFDGVNATKISDKVTTTFQTMNKARFSKAVSLYQRDKNRYWCAMSEGSGTTHDKVFTWDSFNNAWSIYDGLDPEAMAIAYISGNEERPYFGNSTGFVFRSDVGSSDQDDTGANVAINAYFYTSWLDLGDMVNQKAVPNIYIYHQVNAATLTLSYSFDFDESDQFNQTFSTQDSGDVYGTAIYGEGTYASTGGRVIRQDLDSRGRVFRFKIANSTIGETFRIDGIGMLAHLETHQ